MINDQESVHTQLFSSIKQAISSGIGCNTGTRGRYLCGDVCSCVLFFIENGDRVTVLNRVYQPHAEEHAIPLIHYTLTFQGKCYGLSSETESRSVFTDYSFLYFYL